MNNSNQTGEWMDMNRYGAISSDGKFLGVARYFVPITETVGLYFYNDRYLHKLHWLKCEADLVSQKSIPCKMLFACLTRMTQPLLSL